MSYYSFVYRTLTPEQFKRMIELEHSHELKSDPFMNFVTAKHEDDEHTLWSSAKRYRNSQAWWTCSLPDMPKTYAMAGEIDTKPTVKLKITRLRK